MWIVHSREILSKFMLNTGMFKIWRVLFVFYGSISSSFLYDISNPTDAVQCVVTNQLVLTLNLDRCSPYMQLQCKECFLYTL